MRNSDEVDGLRRLELLDSSPPSRDLVLDGTRISPLAFAGIVPVYGTHLFDRRRRQKISSAWGEQAIDGIRHDSAELVRCALRHKFSNPEERLEASGPAGAPFSFANAAIFTQEQMDRVVEDLKQRTRKFNASTKRFVSDSEWLTIDQTLTETGTYASVFMSRATGGDTGLHIAIALGRLRAAQVFVEEGCDVTILNDEGVCAVSILSENFEKVMQLVLRIAQLEEHASRRGPTARRLTPEEKACLARQEQVVDKANEYRLFGHGLACYFVDRLSNWGTLQAEERACEMDGRDMDPGARQELNLCEDMCRYLEQCEAIRDREDDALPPLTPEELEAKAERFTGFLTPRWAGGSGYGRNKNRCQNPPRTTTPTVGANASLATRMGLCMTATVGAWDDDPGGRGGNGGGGGGGGGEGDDDERRGERKETEGHELTAPGDDSKCTASLPTAPSTLMSSPSASSTIRGRGKGISARIAAAQTQSLTTTTTTTTTTPAEATGYNNSTPSDNFCAAATGPAGQGSSGGAIPPPFQGRSLMSAEWISKRGAGAAGRRGHPRYATKGLTPGSWTASDYPKPATGTGPSEGEGDGSGSGDGRSMLGLGSGAGYLPKQHGGIGGPGSLSGAGGHATASDRRRGRRGGVGQGRAGNTKRGLGKDWEGLYQVRSFEDTPE